MKQMAILDTITKSFYKTGFEMKKHSPELFLGLGLISGVACVVTACRATTKVSEILEETKEKVDQIHEVLADEEVPAEKYTEEDSKKDLAIVYIQTGVKLAKQYAPAIMFGALSVVSILASHDIMRKRGLALAAAYTAVDTGFKEYRSRVVERFGKELDQELRYDIRAKEVEERVVDEEGNEQVVTKSVHVANPNTCSDYARFFDCGCKGWEKDAEYNLMYLRNVQNYLNEKLRAQGYLFLNDVYDELGIPRSKAGQIVGWVYNEDRPNGDNFIDFGIYDVNNENARDFVNGYERTILLDFNVDGNIYDLMK